MTRDQDDPNRTSQALTEDLRQIRERLAEALEARARAGTEERELAQLHVEDLQVREAELVQQLAALKAAETQRKEDASKERRAKRKKQRAHRTGPAPTGHETEDPWLTGDEADLDTMEKRLQAQEERERDDREANQVLFDRTVAAEQRDARKKREAREAARRAEQQQREEEEARKQQEEKDRRRRERQAQSLARKEEETARRQAQAAERRQATPPPPTLGDRWRKALAELKRFTRELFGKDEEP